MRKFADDRLFDPRRALTKHFRLGEFTKSATAEKHQLYNIPREEHELANLRALADQILEPARTLVGAPLLVTSGYRCATLNRLIGGAVQSQHMLGEAADFIPQSQNPNTGKNTSLGMDVEEAALLLSAQPDLRFDQLVFEIRERENAAPIRWIHISHKRLGGNRREVLSILHTANGLHVRPGVVDYSSFVTEANRNEA